jgi:hypothetical protein
MQMRGSHSGCVIYLLWRDPSPSARFEMTHAWLSALPQTLSTQLAGGGSAFAGGAFGGVAGAGFFFAAASASFASTSAASTGCIS